MNTINIWSPRWHDRVVLVADHKLATHNEVVIAHKDFPEPIYLSQKYARTFPLEQMKTKSGGYIAVRAIPITNLMEERFDV